MIKKKRDWFLLFFLPSSFLGICLLLWVILFPNRKDLIRTYNQCLAVKPGVTLDELGALFVPANIIDDRGDTRDYYFGTYEYSMLKGAYIIATVDEVTGQVLRLSCGEDALAWDVESPLAAFNDLT